MPLPTTHTAGDTLTATVAWPSYPASAGWVGKLRLVPRDGAGTPVDITAAASGDSHVFTAAAAATATWPAGAYTAVQWAERASEVRTVDSIQLTVLPNPRSLVAGSDTRSVARATLDRLIAARSTWVLGQGGARRIKVGDREKEFFTAVELSLEIAYWEAQVAQEDSDARLAKGAPARNRIFTRFTRPR